MEHMKFSFFFYSHVICAERGKSLSPFQVNPRCQRAINPQHGLETDSFHNPPRIDELPYLQNFNPGLCYPAQFSKKLLNSTFQVNSTTTYCVQTMLHGKQKIKSYPRLKRRKKENKNKSPDIKLHVQAHIQLLTFTPLVTAVEQRGDSSGN